jgi:hypothetical protein
VQEASEEQRAICAALKEGANVIVDAVAGSGARQPAWC